MLVTTKDIRAPKTNIIQCQQRELTAQEYEMLYVQCRKQTFILYTHNQGSKGSGGPCGPAPAFEGGPEDRLSCEGAGPKPPSWKGGGEGELS
jgi:hypothetical protein